MDVREDEVERATAAAVAPWTARIVRAFAAVFVAVPLAVMVVGAVRPEQLPAPPYLFFPAGVFGVLVSAPVLRLDLEAAAVGGRSRWVLDAYPAAIGLVTAFALLVAPSYDVAPALVLVVLWLSGLVARRATTLGLLALDVAAQAVLAVVVDGHLVLSIAFSGLAVLVAWVATILASSHRESVRGLIAARMEADGHADQLDAVASAATDIHVLDAAAVIDAVVATTDRMGWTLCALYAPPTGSDEMLLLGGRGIDVRTVRVPRPQGILREVLATGAPVVRDGYSADPRRNERHPGIELAVGVPVIVHGRTVGALIVGRERAGIEAPTLRLLQLLAAQAGRAMETLSSFELQRQAMEQVEHASKLKDDFVATVSHEVRTPLHVALGMAETLDERWGDLPEQVRHDLVGRLRRNTADLTGLVEVLLDFSRMEAGVIELRQRAFAPGGPVATVVERARSLHDAHRVAFDAVAAAAVPDVVGDPDLVERVIENLVSNACRHTPPGTAVRVSVARLGDEVRFEVRDEGPGIAPSDLERLGERFYRGGDSHLRRTTRGIGLGLAFCTEILALHEAELEVASELGAGATFGFRLPVSDPARGHVVRDEDGAAAREGTAARAAERG